MKNKKFQEELESIATNPENKQALKFMLTEVDKIGGQLRHRDILIEI